MHSEFRYVAIIAALLLLLMLPACGGWPTGVNSKSSRDLMVIPMANEGTVFLLDPVTLGTVGKVTLPAAATTLVPNHAGTKLYAAGTAGLVEIDIVARTAVVISPSRLPYSYVCCISPDDSRVIFDDAFVDLTTHAVTPLATGAGASAFSPDGSKMVLISQSGGFIYSVKSGAVVSFPLNLPVSYHLAVTGSAAFIFDDFGNVQIRALCDGSVIGTVTGYPFTILAQPVPGAEAVMTWGGTTAATVSLTNVKDGCPPTVTPVTASASLPHTYGALVSVDAHPIPGTTSLLLTMESDPPGFGYAVYDYSNNQLQQYTLSGNPGTMGSAITSDGHTAFVYSLSRIYVVDLQRRQELQMFDMGDTVRSVLMVQTQY